MHPILSLSLASFISQILPLQELRNRWHTLGDLPALVLREQSALGGVVMDVLSFTQLKTSHLCQLWVRFYLNLDQMILPIITLLFPSRDVALKWLLMCSQQLFLELHFFWTIFPLVCIELIYLCRHWCVINPKTTLDIKSLLRGDLISLLMAWFI